MRIHWCSIETEIPVALFFWCPCTCTCICYLYLHQLCRRVTYRQEHVIVLRSQTSQPFHSYDRCTLIVIITGITRRTKRYRRSVYVGRARRDTSGQPGSCAFYFLLLVLNVNHNFTVPPKNRTLIVTKFVICCLRFAILICDLYGSAVIDTVYAVVKQRSSVNFVFNHK